jgi:hypothetical protein
MIKIIQKDKKVKTSLLLRGVESLFTLSDPVYLLNNMFEFRRKETNRKT